MSTGSWRAGLSQQGDGELSCLSREMESWAVISREMESWAVSAGRWRAGLSQQGDGAGLSQQGDGAGLSHTELGTVFVSGINSWFSGHRLFDYVFQNVPAKRASCKVHKLLCIGEVPPPPTAPPPAPPPPPPSPHPLLPPLSSRRYV